VSTGPYQIGVDGGGTKTSLVLVDGTGRIAAEHAAPGCNPSLAGPERARAILAEALLALCAKHGDAPVRRTLLCMAGAPGFWRETAAALKGYGTVETARDSAPVLELATGGKPGLVLHAGTGSFVAARALDGELHFAGGLGWRLGDPGSAQDVAKRAFANALLELQGWKRRTALADAVCAYTGQNEAPEVSRWLYGNADDANTRLGGFAPKVVELARSGCQPAQLALVCSLTDLVEQARLVTTKLFGDTLVPCGVSGTLLNSEPALYTLRSLVATHGWNVVLTPITDPPIEGVRRLLLKG
jgi:N-acetylglucosamine kinase-like BadF-type ATPase